MGATPLRLSASANFRAVIRHVHMMSHFDRLGLALMINIPYGTVSRILTMLYNEGYIEKVYHLWNKKKIYEKQGYSKGLPEANHDMRVNGKTNWSYTDKDTAHQQLYRVSPKWDEFLRRWNHFLEKGEDTWQVRSQRTASSSRKKATRRAKRKSGSAGKTPKGGSRSSSAQGQSSVTVTVTTTTSASTRSKIRKVK
jgi:DNA-binding PadR family transcriptional regulator